ncbi:MAG: response regulator, partial [Candidatus Heimdallarchaeota archaeon]|nr:response regulator [Candidatus Heimdallarchaeota archaeon]MCK5049344.1 response regulator [Candidatus Heimdallarchaeota archaeon]
MEILCVDDEEALLNLTKQYLERANPNFVITTCTSAREGLQLLKDKKYDVIISDYQMPDIDGLDFLKMFKSKGFTIPFIIFTGRGKEKVAMEALNLGASRYIQKQGSPQVIYEYLSLAIQSEYQHWSAQQELILSESKFRKLLDNMIVGVVTTNKNRIIDYANNEIYKMMDLTKDELIGRESISFFNEENKK